MKKRLCSLKCKLMAILILCWITPIIMVISVLYFDIQRTSNFQIENEYVAAATHAASIVEISLDRAVSDSREISYDNTIKDAYQKYETDFNKSDLLTQTAKFLTKKYGYDENYKAAYLYYCRDPQSIYFAYNTTVGADYSYYSYYKQNVQSEVTELRKTIDTKVAFISSGDHLYLVRNMMTSDFKPYAVIVLELNKDYIFKPFANLNWQDGFAVYIGESKIMTSNMDGIDEEKSIEEMGKISDQSNIIDKIDNNPVIVGKEKIDNVNMFYIAKLKVIPVMEKLAMYSEVLYLLVIFLVVMMLVATYYAYKNIFNPMKSLNNAAKIIESGEYGYQVEDEVNNAEFSYLIDSMNHMSTRLKEQFEQIYSEELALRDAKIMALQSQINPHFLNNTLEIINWEARMADDGKVSRMIESLSTMLHAATDRNSLPIIPLKEELVYTDAYLHIVSERFGNRLKVIKDIDGALMGFKVPRLIMQPIIENAIEHGMANASKCEIVIKAYENKDFYIDILNNSPLSEKDKDAIRQLLSADKSKGDYATKMGIFNVNARLKMIYGEDAGLTITGTDTHTIASLKITNVVDNAQK